MALTPDPPPLYAHPPAPAATYPAAPLADGGSDTIRTNVNGPAFDILGRNGNPATPAEIAVVEAVLWNWPDSNPLGSWCWSGGGAYLGRGGGRYYSQAFILFEFRTAAEVAAVAGGLHGETPFAVTVFSAGLTGGGALPPADGYAEFQGGPYVPADWESGDSPTRFHRVLIREDLLTGGAGAAWAGEAFLAETVIHEMGHIAQGMLMELYGADYVINNTCDFFGVPTSHWNDPALLWENRAVEASAEMYKDIMFPARRYDNRTHLPLPHARFEDFVKLYVDYFENPFWDYENTISPFYRFSFTFYGYVQGGTLPTTLWLPDYHPVPNGGFSMSLFRALAWPHVGDTPRIHFNFAPDTDRWLDEIPETSDAVTAATYYAKVKAGFNWMPLSTWATTGPGGAAIRTDETDVNPVDTPTGKGVVAANLTGLPDEGHVMALDFPGNFTPWHFPRPDASTHIDFPILPFSAYGTLPSPAPRRVPWWEWNGIKRTRYPLRDILWPYHVTDLPSVLNLGASSMARARIQRVRGRGLGLAQ